MFKDLTPKVANYVYDNGQEYKMICLGGTIPMPYKGKAIFAVSSSFTVVTGVEHY